MSTVLIRSTKPRSMRSARGSKRLEEQRGKEILLYLDELTSYRQPSLARASEEACEPALEVRHLGERIPARGGQWIPFG